MTGISLDIDLTFDQGISVYLVVLCASSAICIIALSAFITQSLRYYSDDRRIGPFFMLLAYYISFTVQEILASLAVYLMEINRSNATIMMCANIFLMWNAGYIIALHVMISKSWGVSRVSAPLNDFQLATMAGVGMALIYVISSSQTDYIGLLSVLVNFIFIRLLLLWSTNSIKKIAFQMNMIESSPEPQRVILDVLKRKKLLLIHHRSIYILSLFGKSAVQVASLYVPGLYSACADKMVDIVTVLALMYVFRLREQIVLTVGRDADGNIIISERGPMPFIVTERTPLRPEHAIRMDKMKENNTQMFETDDHYLILHSPEGVRGGLKPSIQPVLAIRLKS